MKPTNIGHRGIFIRCVIRKKHPRLFYIAREGWDFLRYYQKRHV